MTLNIRAQWWSGAICAGHFVATGARDDACLTEVAFYITLNTCTHAENERMPWIVTSFEGSLVAFHRVFGGRLCPSQAKQVVVTVLLANFHTGNNWFLKERSPCSLPNGYGIAVGGWSERSEVTERTSLRADGLALVRSGRGSFSTGPLANGQ